MRDAASGPVPGPEEERWATRYGTFAPGVGADGRAPRAPRTAKESPAELFARTREIPGPKVTTPEGYWSLGVIVQWGAALPIFLALESVLGHLPTMSGLLIFWMGGTAAAMIHAGLVARPGVPVWGRRLAVIAALAVLVAIVVFDVGRME